MLNLQVVKSRDVLHICYCIWDTQAAPEEVICINNTPAMQALYAGVAELADAQDLKSCGTYTPIRVRFPLPALNTRVFRKYVQLSWIERLATDQKVASSNLVTYIYLTLQICKVFLLSEEYLISKYIYKCSYE